MKAMALCAVLVVGCTPVAGMAPQTRAQFAASMLAASVIQGTQEARYNAGEGPGPSSEEREAFRTSCVEHANEREAILDEMHERAGVYAYAWKSFYETHCVPIIVSPNRVVVDPTIGFADDKVVDVLACERNLTYPVRAFQPTPEERIAKLQRDACESAQ